MKEIILADTYGFCMGVKRAIEIAQKTGQKRESGQVFIWKEIVHNQHVVDDLKDQGIESVADISAIPVGKTVIWSAHGVSPEMWEKAQKLGLKIIDATCPLVALVHRLAKEASSQGDTLVYLGDEGHDEQIGVAGEVKTTFLTIKTVDDINRLKIIDPKKITVLTQTTLSKDETSELLAVLKSKFPQAKIYENICQATTERQEAVKRLVKEVEIIIVVGSPKSANSKRLKEVAERAGAKTIMVDNADELKLEDLKDFEKIGVTSGASTPEEILKEVIEKLNSI